MVKCKFKTKYFEFGHFTDSQDWFVLYMYVLESHNTELFSDILCFIVTDRLCMYLNSPRNYAVSYVKCVFSSFECPRRQEHINNGFRNVETTCSKIWLFPPTVQIPCAQGEMNSESFVVYSFDELIQL